MTSERRMLVTPVKMAASTGQWARRMIRLSHSNATGAAVARFARCSAGSCCRGFSDAAQGKQTHFGFETVPEAEKAKRGE